MRNLITKFERFSKRLLVNEDGLVAIEFGDGAFEWQGRRYRSLSAVARAITDTRWNGWLFFGLKKNAG